MKHMTRRKFNRGIRRAKIALTLLVFFGMLIWALGTIALAAYDYKMAHGIDVFPGIDMLPDDDIARWRNK